MRNRIGAGILLLLCVGSMASCKKAGIQWKRQEVAASAYAMPGDEIEISYPVAEGKFSEGINTGIERVIADFLGDPEKPAGALVDSLLSDRNRDTAVSPIPYTIVVNGETFEYGRTAPVLLNMYQYLGGAHGIGVVQCLTFDTRTGERMGYTQLFDRPDSLAVLNRRIFAAEAAEQIDGLFVPLEELPLPENALLDSVGMHVYYNPYEIAPYSSGSTEYLIPMEEIRHLIRERK